MYSVKGRHIVQADWYFSSVWSLVKLGQDGTLYTQTLWVCKFTPFPSFFTRSISPPSVFPPGHQHVVDCFCFPAASLGVFLKCWFFFCVRRLFSSASCESSASHCVFSHLEANWKRDEFMLSFLPAFVSVGAAEPDPLSPVHLGYERQAVSCIWKCHKKHVLSRAAGCHCCALLLTSLRCVSVVVCHARFFLC